MTQLVETTVKYKRRLFARRTKKRRKARGKSISALKHALDAVFSRYMRAKYPKVCFTCGKTGVTLQCGHFIPRIYLPTRWEELNCRPQCIGCNIFGKGQLLDFEDHLKQEIGEVKVQFLKEIRKKIWKLDREWYLTKIKEYTDKLAQLESFAAKDHP